MTSMSEPADARWAAPEFPEPEPIPTAAELESLQEAAYREAYALGLEEGRAAGEQSGRAAAAAEIDAQRALLAAGIDALTQPLAQMEDALEEQLLAMVVALVGRLFRRQLALDPDSIVGLVRDAVAQLPAAAADVVVQVHPDDAQRLRELTRRSDEQEQQRWRLVEDASLVRGGCRVTSDASEVDARVQTRIERLATELLGDERS